MHGYGSYATVVIVNFPSPSGWFPLTWWDSGSAPTTALMITVGLVTCIGCIALSVYKWWRSLLLFTVMNLFFRFMTFVGAMGCSREGCELAQAMEIAITWQLAFVEISIVLIALMGVCRLIRELPGLYEEIRRDRQTESQ